MSKIIQCPSCSTKLKLGEASAQKSVIACPKCAQKIRLRSGESSGGPAKKKRPAPKRRPEPEPVYEEDDYEDDFADDYEERPRRRSARSGSGSRDRDRDRSRSRKPDRSRDREPRRSAPPKRNSKKKKAAASSNNGVKTGLIAGVVALGVLGVGYGIFSFFSGGEDTPTELAKNGSAVAESNATGGTSAADGTNSGVQGSPVSGSPDSNGTNNDAGSNNSNVAGTPATPPSNNGFGGQPVQPENGGFGNGANGGVDGGGGNGGVAGQQVAAKPAADALKYGFKTGGIHVYNYEINAEIEGKQRRYPGSVTLNVRNQRNRKAPESVSGSGTGFIVTPDGYLLTCHHVIEGATKIQAVVNGKTYPARVVASNRAHDSAIVKIEGGGRFAIVPLANSDSVRLAEDIRAIGYPLTDLLGEDLKVSQGSVSGTPNNEEGKRFQIDAAINPGNSGGPLVNGRGQVVGINSAKLLAGSSISSVGFSVPINYAKDLLKKNNIRFTSKDGGQTLSGPKIASTFKPAMVLLKVDSRPKSHNQFELSYSGSYTSPSTTSNNAARGRGGFPIPRGPIGFTSNTTTSRGKVVLDPYGEVDGYEDSAQLPFTTGSMAMLMIHQLNPDGQKSWSHESKFQLTKPKKRQNNSPFGFGGPRMRGGLFGRPEQPEPDEVLMDGIEVYRYRIVESNANEVKIEKQHELRTLDNQTAPYTLIEGKGTIIFDKKYSMPRSMEYNQTFSQNSENVRLRIPMTITYRMKDPELIAREREATKNRLAKAKADKEAAQAKEDAMTPEERADFYWKALKEKRGREVYAKLAKMDVVESRQKKICDALSPILKERRPDGNAINALAKWATPRIQNQLLAALKKLGSNDWPVGKTMVSAVGNIKSKEAAEAIAARIGGTHPWRRPAKDALIKIGPMAEDAVLAVIENNTNAEMVQVLGAIGTKKSKDVLRDLQSHKDFWVKKAAKEAFAKLASREF